MNQQRPYTLPEAISKIERYCAYQERCHKDVQNKLREMRMIPSAIDHILTHLITNDFLNEERFAMAYVRGKYSIKKWGRKRLTAELKQRNISKFIVRKAIGQINDDDYRITFDQLSKKRLSQLDGEQLQRKRKKLADYLLYRGWETHLVYDKVRELLG